MASSIIVGHFVQPLNPTQTLPPIGMIELDPVVRTRLYELPWLPFSYKHTLTLSVRHLLDRVQEQFPVVGVHLCKKPSHLLKVACVFTANSPCL